MTATNDQSEQPITPVYSGYGAGTMASGTFIDNDAAEVDDQDDQEQDDK